MTDVPAPPPAGLCATCRHGAIVRSRRSAFLRCALADRDPGYARYPLLPVLACRGFAAAVADEPADRAPAG